MGIKKAEMGEFVERYFDCPYCGRLVSDEGGEECETGMIVVGARLKCPYCGKTVLVTA